MISAFTFVIGVTISRTKQTYLWKKNEKFVCVELFVKLVDLLIWSGVFDRNKCLTYETWKFEVWENISIL